MSRSATLKSAPQTLSLSPFEIHNLPVELLLEDIQALVDRSACRPDIRQDLTTRDAIALTQLLLTPVVHISLDGGANTMRCVEVSFVEVVSFWCQTLVLNVEFNRSHMGCDGGYPGLSELLKVHPGAQAVGLVVCGIRLGGCTAVGVRIAAHVRVGIDMCAAINTAVRVVSGVATVIHVG